MAGSVVHSSDIVGTVYDPSCPPVCGPCEVRGKGHQRALWYCEDCEDFFCRDCKAWHGTIKGNRSHNLCLVGSTDQSSARRISDSVVHASDFVEDGGHLSPDVTCGPCEARGQRNKAAQWHCVDCCDFMCDECNTVHGTIKSSRTHTVDPVSEQDFCKKHKGKPIVYFCVTEGDYCCRQCFRENHKTCEEIVPTTKQKKAKLSKEFDVTFPGDQGNVDITGIAFLPDSRLLLVDENNKRLKVFGPDYKILYGKSLPYFPFDIAVYDASEVAVSCGRAKKVFRLSVEKPIAEKGIISTDEGASGIAYISRDKLLVADKVSSTLTVYNIYGKKLSTIRSEDVDNVLNQPCYCRFDPTKSVVYVSNWEGNNVCALDLSSKEVIFNCKNVNLQRPYGISLVQNNIFVSTRRLREIWEISPEGIVIGTVVSRDDMIQNIGPIALSNDGRRLVVSFINRNLVRVYSFL